MYILHVDSLDELEKYAGRFRSVVEPLLKDLQNAERAGHNVAGKALANDYLHVCRWPFRQLEYSFALELIERSGQQKGAALDAGSGITPFGHAVASLGFSVTACDYDRELMREMASAHMEQVYGSSVNYEWQDLTRLTYPDQSFDLVTCISVLEHIGAPHDQAAVRELIRVLKPGGQLILTVDYEPEARFDRLGGRNFRRLGDLLAKGRPLEIFRAVGRRVAARKQIKGSEARHVRTANQPFSLSHLNDDLVPILGSGEVSASLPFAKTPDAVNFEDVPRFWNLVPGLFEVQGRRPILPAGFHYRKPR